MCKDVTGASYCENGRSGSNMEDVKWWTCHDANTLINRLKWSNKSEDGFICLVNG